MADDFESGTRSAIGGGNTTLLPFALQPRGASLRTSVLEYHKEAEGKCYTDYGFHLDRGEFDRVPCSRSR
jgi:dihydropyrimidinase